MSQAGKGEKPSLKVYFRNLPKGTQSPGARSYVQKVQPLQLGCLQATAAAREGEK